MRTDEQRAKHREEMRKYLSNPVNKAKHSARCREWQKRNPAKVYAGTLRQHKGKNRDHILARRAVQNKLRRGTLIRPDKCSNCGITCKPDAHHEDHLKKFDITWLCRPCHKKRDLEREAWRRA